MLAISRNDGEKVMIDGGRIVIQVVKSIHGRTKLGIEAPKDVTVDREEVHARKQAARQAD